MNPQKKYIMRPNLNFKTLLTSPFEYSDLMLKLNKLSFRDDHYIQNALILREVCSLPSCMSWPLVFDPEDNLTRCLIIMQESIESFKTQLSNEAILMNLAENMNRTQEQNELQQNTNSISTDLNRESSSISIEVNK